MTKVQSTAAVRPRMARTCCKYFTVSLVPVAALLLAILFACGILSLPILYSELAKKYEYGIVIDAGSSHTTLYLYKLGVPITGAVHELYNHQSNTSLNSLEDDPTKAGDLVTHLLQHANQSLEDHKVPHSLYSTTRVYLGATAGMRLLKRKNATAAEAIFASAKDAIHNSAFKHRKSGTISGMEEAASGWLTANYIMKEKGLIGALDMGGASTEISFAASAKDNQSHYVRELLMGKKEDLYARSYLCYGYNEALSRFLAHLYSENKTRDVNISNPCMPVGSTKNHTVDSIFSTCVNGSDAEDTFGFSLAPPNLPGSTNLSFSGTGKVDECGNLTKRVFDFYNCTTNGNCDSDQYRVPPAKGKFVGFSGFHYIAEHLNLTNMTFGNHSKTSLMDTVKKQCNNVTATNASVADHCFFGVFMAYMVEGGFGMNTSSKNNWTLSFKKMEGDVSFGWALGYFMNKTYSFPNHPTHQTVPFSPVDMVVGMIILTILCTVFVIFFFLTFYACKKALKTHNGYQSIS